jgi:hypothetical protein
MVVCKEEKDLETLLRAVGQKNTAKMVARAQEAIDSQFANYDANHDGKLQKDEIPPRMRMFFDQLDKDGDGALSKDEAKAIGELLGGLGRGLGGLPGGGDGGAGKDKPKKDP